MYEDNQYTTAEHIFVRLAQVHKNKQFSLMEIVEWCAECELEYIGSTEALRDYHHVPLKIQNLQALLPCNLFRLLDVYTSSNRRIPAYNTGVYLNFNSSTVFDKDSEGKDIVYINYLGIAVDDKTGFPLIKRGHEQACEAFCVWKMYYEDIITDKISVDAKSRIEMEKNIQIQAARSSFRSWDKARLHRMLLIINNMIPRLKHVPLTHRDGLQLYSYKQPVK